MIGQDRKSYVKGWQDRVEDEGQRRDGLIQQLSRSEREAFGSAASLFRLTTRSAK